jgi:hypothetical protein
MERYEASEIFSHQIAWDIPFGERAALEGILSQLKPSLSVEVGTTGGGSLGWFADRLSDLHYFDRTMPRPEIAAQPHVTIHIGDLHELLPARLQEFADQGCNIDFVFFGGDYTSSEDIRRDIEDLLSSPAIGSTVIVVHSAANERVRAGLDSVRYAAWPKVAHVDLDFVAGYVLKDGPLRQQLSGGLGLILVDAKRLAYGSESVLQEHHYPTAQLLVTARDQLTEGEPTPPLREEFELEGDVEVNPIEGKLIDQITELEGEVLRLTDTSARHEALWRGMQHSVSWTITKPLRYVAARVRGR